MAKAVDVQFGSGSVSLNKTQKRKLMDLVEFVKYDQGIASITIDGHTDASGDRYQNLTLSPTKRRMPSGITCLLPVSKSNY